MLEDEHLDVLQNIEFAIVSVHRQRGDLRDHDVMRALDALITHYRAEAKGHTPKEVNLPEKETLIFERVKHICDFRLGRSELGGDKQTLTGGDKTADEIVACLRKIRKSVERWNRRGGQQGYLQFVQQFIR